MPWAMSWHKLISWFTYILPLQCSTNSVSDSVKSSVSIMGPPSADESTTSKNCSRLGWDNCSAKEHSIANLFWIRWNSDADLSVIFVIVDKTLSCITLPAYELLL